MKKQFFQQIGATLLMSMFVLAFMVKAAHPLFLHDHDNHPVCAESYKSDGNAHIHDDRYENSDCSLCAFVLSAPVVFEIDFFLPEQRNAAIFAPSLAFTFSFFPSLIDNTQRRGPPVA